MVARRVVVRQLMTRNSVATLSPPADELDQTADGFEERISDKEEVERLLSCLPEGEAAVVRMYHLEGKSYREISSHVGMPENSVGPMLSRARTKMRNRASQTN